MKEEPDERLGRSRQRAGHQPVLGPGPQGLRRDAQRHPQAPRLTARQVEALELLEGIANDPWFYLEMDFQPGGIQLLNNARLYAREAYVDYEDPTERRHLLRLWLTVHDFAAVEDTLRGGCPYAESAGQRQWHGMRP